MNVNCMDKASMQSEINVTPMIDVLLVLLIIFMVIVPVTSRGDLTAVPQPPTSRDVQPEDPVILQVLKDNQGNTDFKINQQAVSIGDLPARLAEIYANRSRRILFIKGDDQLSFREIAAAIDIGHAAGIDQVGLITPKAAEGL